MVLAHFGIHEDESSLCTCCRSSYLGTAFQDAAACVQSYQLKGDVVSGSSLNELLDWLGQGLFPIASLNLFPLDARWAARAVVVVAMTDERVILLDPLVGRRQVDRMAFDQAWLMRRRKTLYIGSLTIA